MKEILMISYVSMNIEGRLSRCYTALQNAPNIHVKLIQGTTNEIERCYDSDIINVDHDDGLKGYLYFVKRVVAIIKKLSYDFLYLHDYRTAIFSRFSSGEKIIYDAYELIYPGSGTKFRPREWAYYLEEQRTIKKSGLTISANIERAYVMVGKYKLRYIPMVIGNLPSSVNERVPAIKDREFGIVYAGYINENNGIADLIDAVEEYNRTAEIKLMVHLYGKWMLKASVKHYENRGVIYHGVYKLEELNGILQRYVFGYLSYKNENLDTILCAPNKYYDYINNGNVSICNDNYLMMELTNRYKTGCGGIKLVPSINDVVCNHKQYFENINLVRKNLRKERYDELISYINITNKRIMW